MRAPISAGPTVIVLHFGPGKGVLRRFAPRIKRASPATSRAEVGCFAGMAGGKKAVTAVISGDPFRRLGLQHVIGRP